MSSFTILIDEGIYAVVGAASLYGSATKTVSTAVIAFEILGQVEPFLVPVCVGLLVAYWCTSGVTMTLFDVIIEFKNFPYMPSLGSIEAYQNKASDVMNGNFIYLTRKSTLADIPIVLLQTGDTSVTLPIVKSNSDR